MEETQDMLVSNEERPSSDEDLSEDEGLALLPRHTKVVVTGNNRTKRSLVGLQGIVKKAVGLGGWHWLTLSNGDEVRLQRNALAVIEHALHDENDETGAVDIHVMRIEEKETCKFPDTYQPRPRPKRKPQVGNEHSRNLGAVRTCGKGTTVRRAMDRPQGKVESNINFDQLEAGSLRKYRRHFKLAIGPNASKDQLVSAVQHHFSEHTVDESNVLAGFILALHSSHHNS
mmetsp:Transcript_37392/g.51909  ORF Transcript_37392/g.51909 Transcript_37392/m.51909 type:complete len:229 (+) Transcript_37392:318-1004(+)|eukprot:CAMPEP_0196583438 /NCGR_PEP_ID=MMETSP1081-20130531/43600_1 /TAXON_ID=36882 /ORGANISM="Pyramimonas amylifera, Strain CCMP720" /LENGTH=228 /DNA_ID=CAMNT_0041904333 /DNA_START=319 /DNA_END=1005 /DNA_ORIENTATION=+